MKSVKNRPNGNIIHAPVKLQAIPEDGTVVIRKEDLVQRRVMPEIRIDQHLRLSQILLKHVIVMRVKILHILVELKSAKRVFPIKEVQRAPLHVSFLLLSPLQNIDIVVIIALSLPQLWDNHRIAFRRLVIQIQLENLF